MNLKNVKNIRYFKLCNKDGFKDYSIWGLIGNATEKCFYDNSGNIDTIFNTWHYPSSHGVHTILEIITNKKRSNTTVIELSEQEAFVEMI